MVPASESHTERARRAAEEVGRRQGPFAEHFEIFERDEGGVHRESRIRFAPRTGVGDRLGVTVAGERPAKVAFRATEIAEQPDHVAHGIPARVRSAAPRMGERGEEFGVGVVLADDRGAQAHRFDVGVRVGRDEFVVAHVGPVDAAVDFVVDDPVRDAAVGVVLAAVAAARGNRSSAA